MESTETIEFQTLLDRVKRLSPDARERFANRLLQDGQTEQERADRLRNAPSAEQVIAHFAALRPAPDDATVAKWLDEYRMEKYGK